VGATAKRAIVSCGGLLDHPDRACICWGGVSCPPLRAERGASVEVSCCSRRCRPGEKCRTGPGNDACLSRLAAAPGQAAQEVGTLLLPEGSLVAGPELAPARSRLEGASGGCRQEGEELAQQRAAFWSRSLVGQQAGSTSNRLVPLGECGTACAGSWALDGLSAVGWVEARAHAHACMPRPKGANWQVAICYELIRWSAFGRQRRNGAAGCGLRQPRSLSAPAPGFRFSALAQCSGHMKQAAGWVKLRQKPGPSQRDRLSGEVRRRAAAGQGGQPARFKLDRTQRASPLLPAAGKPPLLALVIVGGQGRLLLAWRVDPERLGGHLRP